MNIFPQSDPDSIKSLFGPKKLTPFTVKKKLHDCNSLALEIFTKFSHFQEFIIYVYQLHCYGVLDICERNRLFDTST